KRFGNRVGLLLTWNTMGAVIGVLLTGFLLMPTFGLRNAFNLLAIGLCVPVLLLAGAGKKLAWVGSASALVLVLVLSCIWAGEGWRFVLSSGVYRARETYVTSTPLDLRKQHTRILFYKDAADATVSVEQGDGVLTPAELSLRISGKPE